MTAAESGNGMHLLYALDMPNDTESRELVKEVLEALARRFDDGAVKVDTSVYNAGRILKRERSNCRTRTAFKPHDRAYINDDSGAA